MTISQDRLFAGIDVSAKTFVVRTDATPNVQTYGNTPAGHGKLIRRLSKCGPIARVVLEASGVYSLDLALALHRAPNVEVMVLNPRVARNFAKALKQRSKTDPPMPRSCSNMRVAWTSSPGSRPRGKPWNSAPSCDDARASSRPEQPKRTVYMQSRLPINSRHSCVAVMRKILVAIHAMLKHDVDYDTNRFYKLPDPA